jgi:hypothetical protein
VRVSYAQVGAYLEVAAVFYSTRIYQRAGLGEMEEALAVALPREGVERRFSLTHEWP